VVKVVSGQYASALGDVEVAIVGSREHGRHRFAVIGPQIDVALVGEIPGVASGVPHRRPERRCDVVIEPRRRLFGDLDGVVVVPKKVQSEVIERSLEKARRENVVRKAIEAGMSSTAALKKYKVL